jgi:hypothetical protein
MNRTRNALAVSQRPRRSEQFMADRTSDEEARTLLALIGEIYDAALEPALWPDVLGKLARFVPGMSAAIFAKDAASKTGNIYYDDGGISPQYKQLYFEKYVKLDPANSGHFFSEIGVPVSTVDLLPYDEFLETRFYREWVKPQGIVDFVSSVLDKTLRGHIPRRFTRPDRPRQCDGPYDSCQWRSLACDRGKAGRKRSTRKPSARRCLCARRQRR